MVALRNQRHEFFVREYIKRGGRGAGAKAYQVLSEKHPWKRGDRGKEQQGGVEMNQEAFPLPPPGAGSGARV